MLAGCIAALFDPISAFAQRTKQVRLDQSVRELPKSEQRWALVVGIDEYQDKSIGRLIGAANDAKLLSEALVKFAGFSPDQVILLATDQPAERQPTRINILHRLANLKSVVPPGGLLLFSFSGHGMERNGSAFLIPSDAQLSEDVEFLQQTAVSVEYVKKSIRESPAEQVLLLIDACRNQPGGRAAAPNLMTRAFAHGFEFDLRNREVRAFAALYGASVGERAYEYNEKKMGYFTWAVVNGLAGSAADKNGEVTLRSLIRYVQEIVPKRVGADIGGRPQNPYAVVEGYLAEDLLIASPRSKLEPQISLEEAEKQVLEVEEAYAEYRARFGAGHLKTLELIGRREQARLALIQTKNGPDRETQIAAWELEKRANSLYADGRILDAVTELTEALKVSPDSPYGYQTRGGLYQRLMQWDQAISDFSEAVKLKPSYSAPYRDLAWSYLQVAGQQQIPIDPRALADARQAVAIRRCPFNLMILSMVEPDSERKIELLTQALQAGPDPDYYTRRGAVNFQADRLDLALSDYENAILLRPDLLPAIVARAKTLDKLGRREEAKQEFDRARHLGYSGSVAPPK